MRRDNVIYFISNCGLRRSQTLKHCCRNIVSGNVSSARKRGNTGPQMGKHLLPQQSFRNIVSSFADAFTQRNCFRFQACRQRKLEFYRVFCIGNWLKRTLRNAARPVIIISYSTSAHGILFKRALNHLLLLSVKNAVSN